MSVCDGNIQWQFLDHWIINFFPDSCSILYFKNFHMNKHNYATNKWFHHRFGLNVSLFSLKVTSKHLKGGKETKMDVLVMENLLYRRNIRRLYDLKGSSRSRYNPDTSGNNKVLLDQNLIEAMPTSPIFVGNKAKRLLERAVWNDTAFLAVSLITLLNFHVFYRKCTFIGFPAINFLYLFLL